MIKPDTVSKFQSDNHIRSLPGYLNNLNVLSSTDLLEKHYVAIAEKLNLPLIRPYLRQNRVITKEQHMELLKFPDERRTKPVEILINMIEGKGSEGFRKFVTVLEQTADREPGHQDILEDLQGDEGYPYAQQSPVVRSSSQKSVDYREPDPY